MTLDSQIQTPIFGGSTGGWLRAAQIEEKYAIHGAVQNLKFLKCQLVELPLCVQDKIFYI